MPRAGPHLGKDGTCPLRRCCEAHPDWQTLAQHVVEDFPQLTIEDIARELRTARHVIELASLREDALVIAELIARHRLLMCLGDVPDVARLDPQPHPARAARVAEGLSREGRRR